MKRLIFTLTTFVAMVTGSLNFAQEPAADGNPEYERLKVLEPLVGEYRAIGDVQPDGEQREWRLSFFWSKQKKMLLAESRNRRIDAQATPEDKEWNFGERQYYVWNHRTNRIEWVHVRPAFGVVNTREVTAQGNGVFSMQLLTSTSDAATEPGLFTLTGTADSLKMKFSDRKKPDGQPDEDLEFTLPRVKQSE